LRLLFITVLFFVNTFGSFAATVVVATAANVQYPLREIVQLFQKKYPDNKVRLVVSSSGKLTAQIERGAPYDLFLSADMKYPEYLYKKGLTLGKPKVYGEGILVLWSMKGIPLREKGIGVLVMEKVKRVAIPNPRNAPYGRAAVEALKNTGLFEEVRKKLVYGESVSQTTQYIFKKLVDAGFTSKSVVLSPKMKGKGVWIEVDSSLYSPIYQGVVILRRAAGKKAAMDFYNFLFSEEAKKVLKKYGYRVR